MCYKGKCFGCIPVENGCLALAIISAIATGVALLACIIMGLLIAGGLIMVSRGPDYMSRNDPALREEAELVLPLVGLAGLAAGAVLIIVGVASLIGFIFSVLLCNGICKRRPGQVKSYFVYGIVITVLAVIAAVAALATDIDSTPGLATLLGCVIYSMYLVLVHQTYTKLCAGVVFKDHIRLVEDCAY